MKNAIRSSGRKLGDPVKMKGYFRKQNSPKLSDWAKRKRRAMRSKGSSPAPSIPVPPSQFENNRDMNHLIALGRSMADSYEFDEKRKKVAAGVAGGAAGLATGFGLALAHKKRGKLYKYLKSGVKTPRPRLPKTFPDRPKPLLKRR